MPPRRSDDRPRQRVKRFRFPAAAMPEILRSTAALAALLLGAALVSGTDPRPMAPPGSPPAEKATTAAEKATTAAEKKPAPTENALPPPRATAMEDQRVGHGIPGQQLPIDPTGDSPRQKRRRQGERHVAGSPGS